MVSQLRLGVVAAVSLFVISSAVPAYAQHGHGHGSGSGSHSGGSAAPRQASGSGQSAAPRSPQQGTSSGGAHAVPRPAYRPAPRPGFAYGYRPFYPRYSSFYWGLGGFWGPYFYSPWYYGYGAWGFYPPYSGWGYGDWYGFGGGGASLKVEVQPKTADVYVDGRLAGIVDQFDGMFQSLSIEPGGHEITIYQEGFRPIRQQLYLSPGSTYRIKGALEPLAPGEPNEPRPQAAQPPPEQEAQPSQTLPASPYWLLDPRSPAPARKAPADKAPEPAPEANPPIAGDARFGQVAIRVQPGDAEVLIDGEAWHNAAGAERLVVHLGAGTHRVEIRKDGYDSFVSAVEVRRGETTVLNVSLVRL
jgi:hypothetical protein